MFKLTSCRYSTSKIYQSDKIHFYLTGILPIQLSYTKQQQRNTSEANELSLKIKINKSNRERIFHIVFPKQKNGYYYLS